MANPEYEAKVNPADLYNDEILEQFEAIRNVIHKEILPSTYNELIVTSNQAGVFNNWYDFTYYPSTELIFPLSPQSGNVNWLEKNFLRFKLTVQDSNIVGYKLVDYPIDTRLQTSGTNAVRNSLCFGTTILGVIDGASIFKSIELNYGGTAIWTSAYQQVETFFTFGNIPDQLTSTSPQYMTINKNDMSCIQAFGIVSSQYTLASNAISGPVTGNTSKSTPTDIPKTDTTPLDYTIYIDIDVSRLSPILSWLSIIPGFINKLTLRVVLDAPSNYLCLKYRNTQNQFLYQQTSTTASGTTYDLTLGVNNMFEGGLSIDSGYRYLPPDNEKYYHGIETTFNYSKIKWKMELCEIHQCNATMTEDTRIRLVSLIQQMGGKWIYPCRYWNTTIAPIQNYGNASAGTTTSLQFILTGCYFRSLSFATQINDDANIGFIIHPGNGLFSFPQFTNLKIFCDSELIVSYNNPREIVTDTDSALIDNDKYSVSRDIIKSILTEKSFSSNIPFFKRDLLNKALGPPNGLYSGKYTSEKMGTHNIVVQMTFSNPGTSTTINAWLGALIDGVIVFDNFNGNYFTTGRKMQQVYEALS